MKIQIEAEWSKLRELSSTIIENENLKFSQKSHKIVSENQTKSVLSHIENKLERENKGQLVFGYDLFFPT